MWPFTQTFNVDEVLDYYEVIKEPVDLSTMEENRGNDLYPTPGDFIALVLIICPSLSSLSWKELIWIRHYFTGFIGV